MYNEDLGVHGGWDSSHCTTVLTEQEQTVCECGTFGTFAVIAEMVVEPSVGEEYEWLTVVKYVGYSFSLLLLIVFIMVLLLSP